MLAVLPGSAGWHRFELDKTEVVALLLDGTQSLSSGSVSVPISRSTSVRQAVPDVLLMLPHNHTATARMNISFECVFVFEFQSLQALPDLLDCKFTNWTAPTSAAGPGGDASRKHGLTTEYNREAVPPGGCSHVVTASIS